MTQNPTGAEPMTTGATAAESSTTAAEVAHSDNVMQLIADAPWREAVTYRQSWPHEYVVIKKDGQHDLLAAFVHRIRRGEGVECTFFHQRRPYLFLAGYKYWMMTDVDKIDLDGEDKDDVLNRAPLYRDHRDFDIGPGDTGTR